MIQVQNLVKSFGPRTALAGVDLSVEAGEFVTLVGPNGAGKTTLLRILATLTRPTSGTLRIAGLGLAQAGEEVRRHIGFLSHRTLLYGDLTAEQNLNFYARMYDLDELDRDRTRVAGLLAPGHRAIQVVFRGQNAEVVGGLEVCGGLSRSLGCAEQQPHVEVGRRIFRLQGQRLPEDFSGQVVLAHAALSHRPVDQDRHRVRPESERRIESGHGAVAFSNATRALVGIASAGTRASDALARGGLPGALQS